MTEGTRQKIDELWDVGDVARYLKVSGSTVRERVRAGSIPSKRVGRFIRFIPDDVRQWVESQEAA